MTNQDWQEITTWDGDGTTSDGGAVLFGKPVTHGRELTVQDLVTGEEATVVVNQAHAADLMRHLGAYVEGGPDT